MEILSGLFIIFSFLALGECTSALVGNLFPGNVAGMVYLFIALRLKIVKAGWIRKTAEFFLSNMVIFFIPLFLSILDDWNIVKMNLLAWAVVLLGTTVLVILASGYTAKFLIRFEKKGGEDE